MRAARAILPDGENMMKHEFTLREMILILVSAIMALGIFYYEFAYKNIQADIAAHSTDELTTELTIVQAKAVKYKSMQEAIAAESTNEGEVAVYNNLANEVSEMGRILNGNAQDISINWNTPTLTDTVVRRTADMAFVTTSYLNAKALVNNIINCKYRNVVTDLEITSNNDEALSSSNDISVSLSVTFFETANGASSTQGLTIIETDSTDTAETEDSES